MNKPSFTGFPPATLSFLRELSANNNREWFNDNKSRYESDVLEPAFAFIEAMAKPVNSLSAHYQAIPKRMGGSLMRVYRDVRFSNDKRPYKTNIGIQFRHEVARDVHAPGFYVHVAPQEVFFGVGAWHPDAAALRAIRTRIAERPQEWKKVIAASSFKRVFQLHGDSLKRPPRGFDAEHECIEDLKRKDFLGMCQLDELAAEDPGFYKDAVGAMRAGKPLMSFLCKALDLPF